MLVDDLGLVWAGASWISVSGAVFVAWLADLWIG